MRLDKARPSDGRHPLPALIETPMKTESTAVRLTDYRPPDFAIETVDLTFALDPQKTLVTARLKLRRPTLPPRTWS